MVVFALWCFVTFEYALQKAGILVWHIDHNGTVTMFRSSLNTVPSGPFSGEMVVAISRRFPLAHGARSIGVILRGWALPIFPDPIGAMQPRWGQAKCQCFGPAA